MAAAGYPLQAAHHNNMRRLLDVFSSQLHAFEHACTPDLLSMHDILDCLNRYLAISDATPARLVPGAGQATIGELGERCLAHIEDMLGGIVVSRSQLLAPGRRYLQLFEDRLRRERTILGRHGGETDDALRIDPLGQPGPEDPMGEFTTLCKRLLEVTAQLETDEFGLTVCAACGSAAASSAATRSIALGN